MTASEPQQQQQRALSTEAEDDHAVQQQLLQHDEQQQQVGAGAGAGDSLGPQDSHPDEAPYVHPAGGDGAQHHDPSFASDEGAPHHEHAGSILEAHLNGHLGDDGSGRRADEEMLDPSLAAGSSGGGDIRYASQEQQDPDGNMHGQELGGGQLGPVTDGIGGGIAAPKSRKRKAKDGEEDKPVKASLTAGDWMRVFQFLDEHPELSQLKTVQYFRALPEDALVFNQATLSRTLRKREQITKLFESGPQGPQLKRQRKVKLPHVEDFLLSWIAQRKTAGDMPGGKEIKQKVVSIQNEMGIDPNAGGLKGTNGWLESFIHTHNLLLPPTASSEAKRAKKALIAAKNKKAGGSDIGSPGGLGASAEPSPHPGSSGLGQQSLDSANSHLVMDSYLESDMGGPSSYGLHHGHEAQLANEGIMADVEGFVMGLHPQEQHELQQPSGDGNQAASGDDQQPSTDRPVTGEDAQSNIDPAFQTSEGGSASTAFPGLTIPAGQNGASTGAAPQRQLPAAAGPSTGSTKYESLLNQVDVLERMLETDRADFLASVEQDQADAFEPAETAADLLKALGRLRTYLGVHHQHD